MDENPAAARGNSSTDQDITPVSTDRPSSTTPSTPRPTSSTSELTTELTTTYPQQVSLSQPNGQLDDPGQSDAESQTVGKSSPESEHQRSQSPESTDHSNSPSKSKKRAIDTMLDGDEDRENGVGDKQGPPSLKRMTPPSPTKTKASSSPNQLSQVLVLNFINEPLHIKGDNNYDVAYRLLQSCRRSEGVLSEEAQDFFEQWITEGGYNSIYVADALLVLLLEQYDPSTDVPLVHRIAVVMSQILQRKRKESTIPNLLRITYLACCLTLLQLGNTAIQIDYAPTKAAFDFLKIVNSFTCNFPPAVCPRAFPAAIFDRDPLREKLVSFRTSLVSHYLRPETFHLFSKLVVDCSANDGSSSLSLMTLIGEVTLKAKQFVSSMHPGNFEERFPTIFRITRDIGKFIYSYLVNLIRTEENPAVLSIAQLSMTASFLRNMALHVGALDMDDLSNANAAKSTPRMTAMKMAARLAFEGFTTETKRRDLADWSGAWFRRQIDLDLHANDPRRTHLPWDEVVGFDGVKYIGALFHSRRLLDYFTIERVSPVTLWTGMIYFLYALHISNGLSTADLDSLYQRFVVESDDKSHWKAWWQGLARPVSEFGKLIQQSILLQIQRTPWERLYPANGAEEFWNVLSILSVQIDSSKGSIDAPRMQIVDTIRYLYRELFKRDIEHDWVRPMLDELACKIFSFFPQDRLALAHDFFLKACESPDNAGDLQLLRVFLMFKDPETSPDLDKSAFCVQLCFSRPSLPEIILRDLAHWKDQQYARGLEMDPRREIDFRLPFLLTVLGLVGESGHTFKFSKELLEEFWDKVLLRKSDGELDLGFWGGDALTESMRESFFKFLYAIKFEDHSGLDAEFLRFFVEEKLPTIDMTQLHVDRCSGWHFIAKAITILDNELGVDYISVPLPLLWKIIWESTHCREYAIGLMIQRLLRPGVPTSVHRDFVNSAIDKIIEFGRRNVSNGDQITLSQNLTAFSATLLTLQEFLERKKDDFERQEEIDVTQAAETMDVDSQKKVILLQFKSPNGPQQYRHLTFSPDTTITEFYNTIGSRFGLINFKTYNAGREISQNERDKTLQEWGLNEQDPVDVRIIEQVNPQKASGEVWIVARFDELYDLLSVDTSVELRDFLMSRPLVPNFVAKFQDSVTPWEEMFSADHPLKLGYALFVLHRCIQSCQSGSPEFRWVLTFAAKHHANMVNLIERLSSIKMTDAKSLAFIHCLHQSLYVFDGFLSIGFDLRLRWVRSLPVERIIPALRNALQCHSEAKNDSICVPVMNIMAFASSSNQGLWLKFLFGDFEGAFFNVAVVSGNDKGREIAWTSLTTLFEFWINGKRATPRFPAGSELSGSDSEGQMDIDPNYGDSVELLSYLWEFTINCLGRARKYISHAAKAFQESGTILRLYHNFLSKINPEQAEILLRNTSKTAQYELLNHTVEESVLTDAIDYFTLGWTRLLHEILNLASPEQRDVLIPRNFPGEILQKFLLPTIPRKQEGAVQMKSYCIQTATRGALFDLLYELLDTPPKRCLLAARLSSLLEVDRDVFTDENYIDRNSWLQAPSRLSGIHNLSNTCYMNSLVNQLYMNIDFRNFIFNVDVEDPNGTQSLLHQLRYLFARLQLGNDKAACPAALAKSIIDFEGRPIDINIQMDVDEFFNLLFDRIEKQLKNVGEVAQFRQLYGGVLCHTITSKECTHLSMREENFAAIQCDVRGKRNLEDSLTAYVQGEMMDGDNKYSCEACGRHVDAVKQISIKSVPDNLIFHLKRFEYNFYTNRRLKLNDTFEFPKEIDLYPYTLANIESQENGATESRPSMMYDLVGILVHTGTAESGHYYSYIRDSRPPEMVTDPTVQWYEFNDSEVRPWRIDDLGFYCFGGPEPHYDRAMYPENPMKAYSAYMLFYKKRPIAEKPVLPVISLPSPELRARVDLDNHDFVRKYVFYGEDLFTFVAKLLASMPKTDTNTIDECQFADTTIDLYPLVLGLQVYRLIVSRLEPRPSVDKYCSALKFAIQSSPAARHYFYTWLRKSPGCLSELLLTNVNEKARSNSGHLIADILTAPQVPKPRDGEHDPENEVHDLEMRIIEEELIPDLANLIYGAGEHWRFWEEYFETLSLIARDPDWAQLLIRLNMIGNCLWHLLHRFMDRRQPKRFPKLKYPDNDRIRPKFQKLVRLLAAMFPHVCGPPDEPRERGYNSSDERLCLRSDEWELLTCKLHVANSPPGVGSTSLNTFVYRLFDVQADIDSMAVLVRWVILNIEPKFPHPSNTPVLNALDHQANPMHPNAADVLDVVLKLFDESKIEPQDVRQWKHVMLKICKRLPGWIHFLRQSYHGQDYLHFFGLLFEHHDEDFRLIAIRATPDLAKVLLFSSVRGVREACALWLRGLIPNILVLEEEREGLECLVTMFKTLPMAIQEFLDLKFKISERIITVQSITDPVIEILKLIAATCPGISLNPDILFENLECRILLAQEQHERENIYGADSDDDMDDIETDEDESVMDGSPIA